MATNNDGCSTTFWALLIGGVLIYNFGNTATVGETFGWLNKGRMERMLNRKYSDSRRIEKIIEFRDDNPKERSVIYEFREVPNYSKEVVSAVKMRGADILVECFDGWRVWQKTDLAPSNAYEFKDGVIYTASDGAEWTSCARYPMRVFTVDGKKVTGFSQE
jgi:hypothetical protein